VDPQSSPPPQQPQQPYPPQQPPPRAPATFGQPQAYPGAPGGGYPGAAGAAAYPERPRTSFAAIASLVCGILGCIPLITSILAVLLGIVGIIATQNPRRTGRGIAIAGLVLGLIGIVGWTALGGGVWSFYVTSRPVANVAKQFTSDLAKGDVAAAAKQCEPSIDDAQLTKAAEEMKAWGSLQDLTLAARTVNTVNGVTTWNLVGAARFSGGNKGAMFELHKQADGSCKITSFNFQ
jgi:hypothetical protein